MTADALPYAQGIGYQLRRTYLRLHRVFGTATASQGITPDQYAALWVLVQQDGLTQRELTELMHSDANTVSAILRLMESRRWIRRTRHTRDRRAVCVGITPLGRRTWRRIDRLARRVRSRATVGLTRREVATLVDLLTRVYESL